MSNLMYSLKEKIKLYVDENGQVLPSLNSVSGDNGAETGNGLLYTAIYYILLSKLGELKGPQYLDFGNFVITHEVDPKFKGLFHRATNKTGEQIAWDCYIGIISALTIFGDRFVLNRIKKQALRRYYIFNFCFPNLNPDRLSPFKAWFGRNLWFTSFAKICLGLRYTFLAELILSVRFFLGTRTKSNTAVILNYCMQEALKNRSIFLDYVIKLCQKRINPVDAFAKHFGKSHPLTEAIQLVWTKK